MDSLIALANKDSRVFLLTGDLGFASFDAFQYAHPDRFVNVGVAEQNLVAVATGMALEGCTVFAYSIGPFASFRCMEQFRNGPCYHRLPVIMVSSGAGFAYGTLGYTHYAIEELGSLRAFPSIAIATPADRAEVTQLMPWLAARRGPAYMRLDRTSETVAAGAAPVRAPPGQITEFRAGTALTLLSYGSLVGEAVRAAEALSSTGIECRVLGCGTLLPLDEAAIARACQETGGLLVVEEHALQGGLGEAVAALALEQDLRPRRFARLGVRQPPLATVGSQAWSRQQYGIDAAAIARAARSMVDAKAVA